MLFVFVSQVKGCEVSQYLTFVMRGFLLESQVIETEHYLHTFILVNNNQKWKISFCFLLASVAQKQKQTQNITK